VATDHHPRAAANAHWKVLTLPASAPNHRLVAADQLSAIRALVQVAALDNNTKAGS
jgi:hypothetical protein